jgi:hypothetical protein
VEVAPWGAIEGNLTRHQPRNRQKDVAILRAPARPRMRRCSRQTTMARPCEGTTVTLIFKDALELAGGSGAEPRLENRGVWHWLPGSNGGVMSPPNMQD